MEEAPESPDPTSAPPNDAVAPSPDPPVAARAPLGAAPVGRAVWWEVVAVLAVGVVPSVAGGIVSLCDPAASVTLPPLPYWLDSFSLVAHSGCTIVVVLYLMSRSGESWEHFGLAPPRILDAPLGAFLMLVAIVVWSRMPPLPDFGFLPRPGGEYPRPHGAGDYVLMVVKFALAGFAEELVLRAYLITRLKVLLRSRGEAVVFAALLFAVCHLYQGPYGVIHALVFGLTFGVIFLVIGRVWSLAFGHALYNILIDLRVW